MSEADVASLAGGLRQAMRGIAATVIALATRDAGGVRHGIAATSVTSLSLDPPSLLACINTTSSIAPHLDIGTFFSANVLRVEHESVSRVFSDQQRRDSRFTEHAWDEDERGVPYLTDAQSILFCRVAQAQQYGTHRIAIGEVYNVLNSETEIAPLIYVAGRYAALAPLKPGN